MNMNPNPDPEILRIPYSGGVFEIRAEHAEAFFGDFEETLDQSPTGCGDFEMVPYSSPNTYRANCSASDRARLDAAICRSAVPDMKPLTPADWSALVAMSRTPLPHRSYAAELRWSEHFRSWAPTTAASSEPSVPVRPSTPAAETVPTPKP